MRLARDRGFQLVFEASAVRPAILHCLFSIIYNSTIIMAKKSNKDKNDNKRPKLCKDDLSFLVDQTKYNKQEIKWVANSVCLSCRFASLSILQTLLFTFYYGVVSKDNFPHLHYNSVKRAFSKKGRSWCVCFCLRLFILLFLISRYITEFILWTL